MCHLATGSYTDVVSMGVCLQLELMTVDGGMAYFKLSFYIESTTLSTSILPVEPICGQCGESRFLHIVGNLIDGKDITI